MNGYRSLLYISMALVGAAMVGGVKAVGITLLMLGIVSLIWHVLDKSVGG